MLGCFDDGRGLRLCGQYTHWSDLWLFDWDDRNADTGDSGKGATASQANTTGPIDDVVTPDNAHLYVIDSNAGASPGTIAGFSIAANRSLTSVTTGVTGLLPGPIGLVVR